MPFHRGYGTKIEDRPGVAVVEIRDVPRVGARLPGACRLAERIRDGHLRAGHEGAGERGRYALGHVTGASVP